MSFRTLSVVNIDRRAHRGPIVEPLSLGCGQVDAAVAHRMAEVRVPVGAVEAVAPVEVHRVGHVGQVIAGAGHIVGDVFDVDAVLACGSRRAWQAGRDERAAHGRVAFIGDEPLCAEVNVNPATAGRGGGRGRWSGTCAARDVQHLPDADERGVADTVRLRQRPHRDAVPQGDGRECVAALHGVGLAR